MTGYMVVWGRGRAPGEDPRRGEATYALAFVAGCPWVHRDEMQMGGITLAVLGYTWCGPPDGWIDVRVTSDGADVEGWGLVLPKGEGE